MSTEVIVLICLGIGSCVALSVLVLMHLRHIIDIEEENNAESFCVVLPQHYVLLGFIGFCVTIALLVIFSIHQIINVYIQALLGMFAVSMAIFVLWACIYSIYSNEGEIIKQSMFSVKKIKLADINQKKTLSFGYCTQYFVKDKKVFVVNQDCIGVEYLKKQTSGVSEIDQSS